MDNHSSIRGPCMALGIFSPSMTAAKAFEEPCSGLITGTGLLNPPDCTNIVTLWTINFNDGKFLLTFFQVKNRYAPLVINLRFENNFFVPLAFFDNAALPAFPI